MDKLQQMTSGELADSVIRWFVTGPEEDEFFRTEAEMLYQGALMLTSELNGSYHEPAELRRIFSVLIGKEVDETLRLFPPFYTDFGKNISIGKDVFINSSCHFQDQGGITIGNGVMIGHNVVIATINHDLLPENNRKNHYAPVHISDHVWIGSNAAILPGVTIGEWSVVGAGSVVTKDVPPFTVVGGVPAKVIKRIGI